METVLQNVDYQAMYRAELKAELKIKTPQKNKKIKIKTQFGDLVTVSIC